MQKTRIKKSLSSALSIVLIAASALFASGCSDSNVKNEETLAQTSAAAENQKAEVVGEGQTSFDFTVTDKDGIESRFEVHTDKTIVGEALQDIGLIEGEAGEYGLFVKAVNGITADYDTDGVYWAFYVNGEYASAGVDQTPIEEGSVYSFKVE